MNRAQIADVIVSRLQQHAAELRSQWSRPEGTETRHFILDGLLPADVAQQIHDAYPKDGSGFRQQASTKEHKKTSANIEAFAPILQEVSYAFQSQKVVDQVAEITGMRTIEPDPLFYAGGLSMMFRNDFLNPHIDNSHDAKRNRYRRLNLLYYVTPDWQLGNGGNFELWDRQRKTPKTLVSAFNRLVVMETTSSSFHSVSKVQVDRARCCVSNYFFSKDSPTGKSYFHVTSFFGRPEQKLLTAIGHVDNLARGIAARLLRGGRGRKAVNQQSKER